MIPHSVPPGEPNLRRTSPEPQIAPTGSLGFVLYDAAAAEGESRATFMIPLPWRRAPLSLNHRRSRYAHARLVREVRETGAWMVKQAGIQPCRHVIVRLHYRPRDNRRRDTDNLIATAKPLYDALVDAQVVPDDIPAFMTKLEPVIHPYRRGATGSTLWLQITVKEGP